MASAQVYRFQRRLNTLQSHHELALKRHSVSNKSYETRSRDVMNSLITHLAESEKKLKKTKRTAKPRISHPTVPKQSRCNDSANPTSSYFPYTDKSRYSCRPDQMDAPCVLQHGGREHVPFLFGENVYHHNHTNEPIFPPPTYAEQSGPSSPASLQAPSRNTSHPPDSYLAPKVRDSKSWTGVSNYSDSFHSNSATYSFGMYADHQFTPNRLLSYDLPTTQHDSSTVPPSIYSCPTGRPWSSFIDSHTDFTHSNESYPDDVTSRRQSLRSPTVHKFDSVHQKQHPYGVNNNMYDHNVCGEANCMANDLSIFPRLHGSAYPGINPILASTYPLGPGYRADEAYRPLSAATNYPGTNFSPYTFTPLSVNTDTAQYTKLPDLTAVVSVIEFADYGLHALSCSFLTFIDQNANSPGTQLNLVCDVSRQLNVLHQAASFFNRYDIRYIATHLPHFDDGAVHAYEACRLKHLFQPQCKDHEGSRPIRKHSAESENVRTMVIQMDM
ncbi:hypothetical protein T265_12987, partial [Opisthorchis viverrini]